MTKNIKTQVLIIGGGSAGLSAAIHLKNKNAVLVESPESNSILSGWNIIIKPKKELRLKILKAGDWMADTKLLNKFIANHNQTVSDLKSLGIIFRISNLGSVPIYKRPGLEIKKKLNRQIRQKGIKILNGKVESFLINQDKIIKAVV